MLTDAHCHPYDLARFIPQAEQERCRLGVLAAASACDSKEFAHNEELALKAAEKGAAPLLPCFAIHPQQPAASSTFKIKSDEQMQMLDALAAQGKIAAVGECGFDLYDEAYRETDKLQESIFTHHLEAALRYDLSVVLHVRRAMHKIFAVTKSLAKCRAVVFHSWPGTFEEGLALLRRGVNAYFSFGNVILNGHKKALHCCSVFPAERLLTETDAPFQPARGQSFSQWSDLVRIVEGISSLRREAGENINEKELEAQVEINFRKAFL